MNETQLVVGAKLGQKAAFDSLYRWLLPQVYRYAMSRCGDHSAAEEITSDCFVAMIENLAKLPDDDQAVLGWMVGTIRHKSVDWIRRQQVSRKAMNTIAQKPLPSVGEPSEGIEREERQAEIQKALANTRQEYQTALRMRYIDGVSQHEMSRRMKMTDSAINSLLYRARAAFRVELRRLLSGAGSNDSTSAGGPPIQSQPDAETMLFEEGASHEA